MSTNSLIGVSLPWDFLSDQNRTKGAVVLKDVFRTPRECLDFLKDQGASSVELRHRLPEMKSEEMTGVLEFLKKNKMGITIHGEVYPHSEDWTAYDLLPWMKAAGRVFDESDEVMITLHPVSGEGTAESCRRSTIRYLRRLADEIGGEPVNYRLALENQRDKGKIDPGTTFSEVADMHRETGHPAVGVCWDMGHGYSNYHNNFDGNPLVPPRDFIAETIHTHIHDLGPDGKTHWPFLENRVPLEQYTDLLRAAGYGGVYNLELSFDRFSGEPDIRGCLKNSIRQLNRLTAR